MAATPDLRTNEHFSISPLLVFAWLILGCHNPCDSNYVEGWGSECTGNDDCSDAMECIHEHCEIPCVKDDDCPDISDDWGCSPYNGLCAISCSEK